MPARTYFCFTSAVYKILRTAARAVPTNRCRKCDFRHYRLCCYSAGGRGVPPLQVQSRYRAKNFLPARAICSNSLRVGTRKKGPSNDGPVCFLFLFFFFDGDGDAEVGKLKVIDRGGALGHRFGRVLHFRIGNHVTKRLRLQHLHAKPVKP